MRPCFYAETQGFALSYSSSLQKSLGVAFWLIWAEFSQGLSAHQNINFIVLLVEFSISVQTHKSSCIVLIRSFGWILLDYPPYCPELWEGPCEFHIFQFLKKILSDKCLKNCEEVKLQLRNWLFHLKQIYLKSPFESLLSIWRILKQWKLLKKLIRFV